jgi:CelD/BcsL family acetyltransferase involved in cellulose biosynthesis
MLAPRELALITEWRPLADLAGIADEWRALARRAAEPNVFYAPDFALAAAPALAPDAGAVLVRTAGPQQLIGLFPCRIERRRYGVRLPLLTAWTHPYAPLGTPLIDQATLLPAVTAFLDHVADDPKLPKLLLLPYQVEDGPVAMAIGAAIAQRGGRTVRFDPHARALLAPAKDRAGYLDATLEPKRRKKLERQRRRLDKTGGTEFTLVGTPAEAAEGLKDFFSLETSGWKGASGTAAAQSDAIRRFMEIAVAGLAAQGQARVARFVHAGRAIAAAVLLTSGRGAWFWKIAHDDAAGRASPGVQITLEATEAMLRDEDIAWCDSCAAADHPMINLIWRERRPMADLLCALGPGVEFAIAYRLEALRRRAIAAARKVRAFATR